MSIEDEAARAIIEYRNVLYGPLQWARLVAKLLTEIRRLKKIKV